MKGAVPAALAMLAAAPASAADLLVEVRGATPGTGQFLVALFDSEATWMIGPTDQLTVPVDAAGSAGLVFHGLAPGRYAVSVVHDENANGELDLNLLGVPTEGFGFSNDAGALFGPPDWADASFDLGADGAAITIRLDRAE